MATSTGLKQQIRDVFVAFGVANYRLLFVGRVTSNMGRTMRVFLRGWMVLELTDSPFLMGVVISSLSWPMLVMPFIGGVMADRMDRKLILKWTESLLVILWTFVAVIVVFGALDIGPDYLKIKWWHFVGTSFISGVIQSIGRPGHQAMIGSVVNKDLLASAVALDSISETWPRVAGPALAALFIGIIGGSWHTWAPWLFGLTAAGQLFTAITIFMLRWEPGMDVSKTQPKESAWRSFLSGMQVIKNDSVLLGLVVMGIAFMIFAGGAGFLLPVFARDVLGLGDEQGATGFGVLMTIQALGAALGSLSIAFLSSFKHRGMLMLVMAILHSLSIIAFSQSTIFLLSLFLVLGNSMTAVFFRTVRRVVMQMVASNEMRGRIMSIEVFQMGLSPFGILLWGAVAEIFRGQYGLAQGTQHTWLLGGVLYGIVAILFFAFVPSLRRFR